jgi:nitrate/nitrite transporter NarK
MMLSATLTPDNSIAIVLLALGLAFMDVTAPVSWAVAIDLGGKNSGAVTGAMNTAGLLGGTVTSLGIGYIISSSGSYELPVVILAIQLLIGALFAIGLQLKSSSSQL